MTIPQSAAATENPTKGSPTISPVSDDDIDDETAEEGLSLLILTLCPSITNEVFIPLFRSTINSAMIYDAVIDPSSVV